MLAAKRGRNGETYLLVGGSYPMDEIRRLVISALGTSPPYLYLPTWMALSGAWGIELMARLMKQTPIVTRRNILSTVADRVFSIEKARQQLGFNPRVSLAEAVQETVSWYKAQGAL
jgi:nucleoside-diphosphate-sugar epimerase